MTDKLDTTEECRIMNRALEAIGEFIRHGSANYRASHREDWRNILSEVESGAARFLVTLSESGGSLTLAYHAVPNLPS